MAESGLQTFQYRPPWYLLGLILVAAILATIWVSRGVQSGIDQNAAQADALQRLQLQRVTLRVDDFFASGAQLTYAAAAGPCSVRGDRSLVRQLLEGLMQARLQSGIFGLGCFFEPRAFDGRGVYFGPYSHIDGRHLVFLENADGKYKYTALPWYRTAVAEHGGLIPYGPYFDVQERFISFLKAFYSNGRLAGVASVDTTERTLQRLAEPERGEYVYVEAAGGARRLSAGTPFKSGVPTSDMSSAIRFSGARLHLVASRVSTLAENRRDLTSGALIVGAIWLVAALMTIMLLRSWRAKQEQVALRIQQVQLENQIALRDELETRLRRAAYLDGLTGLPNRAFILDKIGELLMVPERTSALLVLIDLDGFSTINDTLGHESGDALLVALAERLKDALGAQVVARIGGDEFVILDLTGEDAAALTGRIQETFKAPVRIRDRVIHLSASLGFVSIDTDYVQPGDVLRDAEIAMYNGKREGRGSSSLFNAGMRRQLELDAQLASDLRRAIDGDEFLVHYQPLVDLSTRTVVSLEALARWERPGFGLTYPVDFIPYAEAHGMVSAIDSLVLHRVCDELVDILAVAPKLCVAVNCSMAQLTSDDIVHLILNSLGRRSLDPSNLRLEITETSIMRNATYALDSLERLRAAGVLTVVDDFGTGYSSLAYLQRLPITGVKIDRSFITPLDQSTQARAIVRSIILLAETLGLYTVAEGVENAAQLAILRELGCTYGQGYLFAPPVALPEVLDLLKKRSLETSSS